MRGSGETFNGIAGMMRPEELARAGIMVSGEYALRRWGAEAQSYVDWQIAAVRHELDHSREHGYRAIGFQPLTYDAFMAQREANSVGNEGIINAGAIGGEIVFNGTTTQTSISTPQPNA